MSSPQPRNSTAEFTADGAIGTIRLNRPERLNAVDPALVEDLLAALAAARAADVRALVLTGNGPAFCAGHDLKQEPQPHDPAAARARIDRIQDVTRALRAAPFPVIAAVHGYALGAGCEFALGCDLVVADETAQFGFPEVSVGLSVTGGISRLLTLTVGPIKAKELVLLGARFGAAEGATLGLVTRVTAPGEHESTARALATELAGRPPFALALAKELLDAGLDGTLEDAFDREVGAALRTEHSGEDAAARAGFAR
ncbi:enoyl-CoA hydratase/isomerase family protein [Pseudonocardia sp. GCM10023141]|uniref:enoyl-CoA hydratase/isomerase family protein n=1 Tax=Pseudonocardia sp. GCM10023141 TaxID=3252653 RepID=UPI00361A6A56